MPVERNYRDARITEIYEGWCPKLSVLEPLLFRLWSQKCPHNFNFTEPVSCPAQPLNVGFDDGGLWFDWICGRQGIIALRNIEKKPSKFEPLKKEFSYLLNICPSWAHRLLPEHNPSQSYSHQWGPDLMPLIASKKCQDSNPWCSVWSSKMASLPRSTPGSM